MTSQRRRVSSKRKRQSALVVTRSARRRTPQRLTGTFTPEFRKPSCAVIRLCTALPKEVILRWSKVCTATRKRNLWTARDHSELSTKAGEWLGERAMMRDGCATLFAVLSEAHQKAPRRGTVVRKLLPRVGGESRFESRRATGSDDPQLRKTLN